ncbi:MAG: hypothetical protein WCC06_03135 [Candidatus Aminicenantales bacterium]
MAAFYLGYVGFAALSTSTGQDWSFWDLAYLSLQLFTLESGSAAGPKGWELARFLAPTLAAYTALRALMAVFRSQVNSFRLRLTNPDLVPWEKLSEEIKEKDRHFIRELPRILGGVDLQIERIPQRLY